MFMYMLVLIEVFCFSMLFDWANKKLNLSIVNQLNTS